MGQIVAAAAASHSPGIVGMGGPEPDPDAAARFHAGMHRIGAHFEESDLDVLLVVTSEHFANFYLNNVPAICIGTGTSFGGPVEPYLGIPWTEVPGAREVAKELVSSALEADFDVSFSEELKFDHGTMVPLHYVNPKLEIPIVPILVNNLYEPMPSPRRLHRFGGFLAQAIQSGLDGARVGLLATGGLSHKVGTPDAGEIRADFDRSFLADVEKGSGSKLAGLTHAELAEIGNGTHEVRNWLCVMGAVGDRPAEIAAYEPIPEWATGCAAVIWTL